jgi:hypothetical protein
MDNFVKHFARIAAGKWMCVTPGKFDSPIGPVQVTIGSIFTIGTSFMGFDLAERLEAEYRKHSGG